MIKREIKWLSSLDPKNDPQIDAIGSKLAEFYQQSENYYEDIDGTSQNWINPAEKGYVSILKLARDAQRVCEFGCGSANILKHYPELQLKYSGCDFSTALMEDNRKKYHGATFKAIEKLNHLPFADQSFDLVFSIFVIEHCNRPHLVLNDCARVLKPGGTLVILCPDFLGCGRMSSQRSGFGFGTSKEKLREGKYLDAAVTLFDNRIRIPFASYLRRQDIAKSPRFFINVNPTVFEDPFRPDVDAIYLTSKEEMAGYLSGDFNVTPNPLETQRYERERQVIFLSLKKRVK